MADINKKLQPNKHFAKHDSRLHAIQELEARVSAQLREASAENQSLRKELARLEDRNNQLQGYGLDDMSADELSGLIHGLTQVCFTDYRLLSICILHHIGMFCFAV